MVRLIALVLLFLCGMARAQGTYYDAPSTPIDITQSGFGGDPSYTAYAHDTRLWIPNDVTVIRGVIVLANGAGGDQRGRTAETDWQAFARAHGFALMGTHGYVCYGNGTTSVDTEVPVLLGDLAWYATASGHPEVTNLPFVLGGWSGGGQVAYGINTKIPERVIAFITNKGAYYIQNPLAAAALKTPSIGVAGQLDGVGGRTAVKNNFESNRPLGALWADAFEWNTPHAEGNVDGVFFTFFDHAIRARYPAGATPLTGPVTLLDLPETSGWLATEPTESNGLSGSVYAYADYPGTKTSACWLMDADVANLYRGFATYGPANTAPAVSVTPVSVSGIAPVYATGQMIQFNVAVDSAAFPGWVSADVYDGAVKLGTVTNGGSTSVSAVRPWGGRGVTAIARDAAGNERTSIPQPFVVSNAVALTNSAATPVHQTSADLNATFSPAWGSYTITACWGTVNGGSTVANWQHSAVVGTWDGGDPVNLSYTATGLGEATTYYYTFSAAKSGKQVWATNVLNFTTDAANPNAPTSTNAVLTSLEDTATALAAGDFGYTDPGSVALAAVQIASLPALGTLNYNGTAVTSVPLTVAAANIGSLTYQAALHGNGTSYTTVGIKVGNANGLWSDFAVMTVNVMTQDLHTSVNAGDSLAVTFQVMRDQYGSGLLQASFLVGSTEYGQSFDTSTQTAGAWVPLTLNQTIPTGVTGNLSLRFSNVSGRAGGLDNIGNVSVMAAPVPASYAGWATANGLTGGVSGDSNNDGVPNGTAYFTGVIGPATNPVQDAGRKVTWTNGGNIPSSAYGNQFVVKTSTDLVTWTPVAANDPNLSNTAGSVSYTLPPGAGKIFVRLVVTPN